MSTTILFQIQLPFRAEQDGNTWLGYCDALEIVTQAPTLEALRVNLRDAIQGFVESCYERGVLEQVLKDGGFQPEKQGHGKQAARNNENVIDVPLPLVAKDKGARGQNHPN